MNLRRMVGYAAAAVAGALALTACSASNGGGNADGAAEITVAVDSFTIGTPVFVGMDQGYFAEQDLVVDPAIFQTGVEGVQALTTGQVDYAFALDFAAVSSISDKLVLLGAVSSPAPGFHKFYIDTSLGGPAGLAGEKVGVLPGTAQAYSTQLWLEKNGIADEVELVEFPGVYELVGALRSGEIQGGFIFGVGVPEADKIDTLEQITDDSEVLAMQGMYLMSTREFVDANPETTSSLLTALGQAADFTAADFAAAAQITAAQTKGDADAIEPSLAISNPGLAFVDGHRQNLLAIQDFLIAADRIPAGTDVAASIDISILSEIEGAKVE